MLKVNNRNIRTRCAIFSSVSIVNFEHVKASWEKYLVTGLSIPILSKYDLNAAVYDAK